MNWLIFTFIPPLFLAVVNHLDKYLISRFVKGGSIGALIIFSSVAGIPTLLLIGLFNPHVFEIPLVLALILTINGCIYLMSILLYLYALSLDETSIVSPLSQMATVISYILGFVFLGELLSIRHFISAGLIISGAIGLSLEIKSVKYFRLKSRLLFFMFGASFFFALNGLIFKMIAIKEPFWTVTFWEYVGYAVFSFIVLFFVQSFRQQFFRLLKTNSLPILSLNGLNEILAVSAKTSFHFATLLAPLALVYLIADGFQPFFVLILGILFTIFFPSIAKEKIGFKYLFQKIVFIACMTGGILLLPQ